MRWYCSTESTQTLLNSAEDVAHRAQHQVEIVMEAGGADDFSPVVRICSQSFGQIPEVGQELSSSRPSPAVRTM